MTSIMNMVPEPFSIIIVTLQEILLYICLSPLFIAMLYNNPLSFTLLHPLCHIKLVVVVVDCIPSSLIHLRILS